MGTRITGEEVYHKIALTTPLTFLAKVEHEIIIGMAPFTWTFTGNFNHNDMPITHHCTITIDETAITFATTITTPLEDYKTVALTITTTRFEKMMIWTADAVHLEIPMTVTVGINDDVHAAKVFVTLNCGDMTVIGKLTTVLNEITLLDMDVRFILTEAVIYYRFAVFVPFNCIVKMNVNEMVNFDVLLDVTDEVIHCNVA